MLENYGIHCEWNELEYHEDILTAFNLNFNLEGDKNLGEVRLIPLDDWKANLEKTCDNWFFEFTFWSF